MTTILQDSAFYTNESGTETVWDKDPNNRFYVVRAGEMRIHAMKNGHEVVIRYTDRLMEFGIKDDAALAEWSAKEELFEWVNNSWFEVYDSNDTDYFSDPLHSFDEAVKFALEMSKTFGKDGDVE